MLPLDDERAIEAVLKRYATGIDQKDWALFETCFTEDCLADYPGIGRWRGARAITDYMREVHRPCRATLHRLSNIVIEGEGMRAAARTYVDAVIVPLDEATPVMLFAGYYKDVLVKADAQWRIAARNLAFVDRSFRDQPPARFPD